MTINSETGELVLDEYEQVSEQYKPTGLCSQGCGHLATELWQIYGRRYPSPRPAYDFRCKCCVVEARLERARAYVKRIPQLEAELEAAKAGCGQAVEGKPRIADA